MSERQSVAGAARGGGGGAGVVMGRASTVGTQSELERDLVVLEQNLVPALTTREFINLIEEIGQNRQRARAALERSRGELQTQAEKLERTLDESKDREKVLNNSTDAENELARLSERCQSLRDEAAQCDEAKERARENWDALESDCRKAEDMEICADLACLQELPNKNVTLARLMKGTNAFFDSDGTECRLFSFL